MFNKKDEKNKPAQKDGQKAETKPTQQKTETPAPQQAVSSASAVVSQREAVFVTVMRFFKEAKVNFTGGKAGDHITPEMRKNIINSIADDFRAKKVALKDTENNREKLGDEKQMYSYVNGLLGNWLRRDPRLNGEGEKKKN